MVSVASTRRLGVSADCEDSEARADGLRACLERWLRSAEAAPLRGKDGLVEVEKALEACDELNELADGSPKAVVAAVRARPHGAVACNVAGNAVRCRDLLERVRLAAEVRVAATVGGGVRTLSLMRDPEIRGLLAVISEPAARVQALLEAVRGSTLLTLAEHGASVVLEGFWQDKSSLPSGSESGREPGASTGGRLCGSAARDCGAKIREGAVLGPRPVGLVSNARQHGSQADVDAAASPAQRMNNREKICKELLRLLNDRPPWLGQAMLPDGSITASVLLESSTFLQSLCFGKPSALFASASRCLAHHVEVDSQHGTLRLFSWEERLGSLAEAYLRGTLALPLTGGTAAGAGAQPCKEMLSGVAAPLSELLALPDIKALLCGAEKPCWQGDKEGSPEALLRAALRTSDRLEVHSDEGEAWVVLRPPEASVCAAIEVLLDHNPKARTVLAREGEVPLSWIVDQAEIRSALKSVGVQGNLEAALELLRAALQTKSRRFRLDGNGSRASVCPAASVGPGSAVLPEATLVGGFGMTGAKATTAIGCSTGLRADSPVDRALDAPHLLLPDVLPSTNESSNFNPGWMPRRRQLKQTDCVIPRMQAATSSRVKSLRLLLAFYFDLFNMQHNRLLLSLAQAQYPVSRSRRPMDQPLTQLRFRVRELRALPRLDRLLSTAEGRIMLHILTAALSTNKDDDPEEPCPLPLRLTWVDGEAHLEVLSAVKLRLLEVVIPPRKKLSKSDKATDICPELRPLFGFEDMPVGTAMPLPPHVILVVSYSVSSDLSHSQSPKAASAREAIYSCRLEPQALFWESRLQKLRRQLLHYGSDIVCLQALQSIGFNERCSEQDTQWFSFEDEPSANHLVHLYRELNKANYGVVFAPTMKLPESATICLGNAVFWKRSRWRLDRHFKLSDSTVCVRLTSRNGGLPILACSTKTAASYVLEWGDTPTEKEILHPLQAVAEGLSRYAAGNVARILWCGDFGCGPAVLKAGLPQLGPAMGADSHSLVWESAYGALGQEPWTSASPFSAGLAVDHVLAAGLGRLLATLGAWPGPPDAVELLQRGFPSDHLLLLAAYADEPSNGLQAPSGRSGSATGGRPRRGGRRRRQRSSHGAGRSASPGRSPGGAAGAGAGSATVGPKV